MIWVELTKIKAVCLSICNLLLVEQKRHMLFLHLQGNLEQRLVILLGNAEVAMTHD